MIPRPRFPLVHPRAALVLAVLLGLAASCRRSEPEPPRGDGQAEANATPAVAPTPAPTDPPPASTPGPRPLALAQATPADPLRPQVPPGPTVRNHPAPPSEAPPKLDALALPPGFSIALYTDEVPHARSLARGARGTIFVGTRRSDRVFAVVDADGDHHVDAVHTVASGLETPNGVAYRDGDLYIADRSRILRLPGIDQRLRDPPKPELVTDALPDDPQHGWRYLRFGPDGLLYIPIGAPCNACLRQEPIFASIARLPPQGGALEIFAHGVRNSLGLDWHPQTKELWFTENGRDELGNDLPPDELDRAPRAGLHFGYPYCHGGDILDPEHGAGRSCTDYEAPVQRLGPHVAALGMRFYTGSMFPARYHDAVILAEHGSWNREEKLGYRIMVVPTRPDGAAGYEPLVTGFLDDGQAWGRPVDVELLDDGSLLISDDWKGAIYRLSYQG